MKLIPWCIMSTHTDVPQSCATIFTVYSDLVNPELFWETFKFYILVYIYIDCSSVHLWTFYFYKKFLFHTFNQWITYYYMARQCHKNGSCVRWEINSAEVVPLQFIRVRPGFIKFGLTRFCNHYSILRDPWLVTTPSAHGDGQHKEKKLATFTKQTRTSYSEKLLEQPCKADV